jgi:prophage tail gpP-like protein
MTDDLTLSANGRDITGWEQISVSLYAEAFPPMFAIALSSRDPDTGADLVVRPGDACTVKLGEDLVITGYVDRVGNSGGASAHALRVVGRGKTQDLVDCSAEWDSGQIASASVLDIATKLAKPYGITVALENGASVGAMIPQTNITYGETGADIIQRDARSAGLLAYEGSDGHLLLAAVGKRQAASGIVYGENVEEWDVELSMDQRYSEIVCTLLSQDVLGDLGEGGFFFDTETDPNVPRHRRRYIVLEQAQDAQAFTIQKAKWEVARRAGRGQIATATIDSWRDSAGGLWMPNTLVPVSLPGLPAQTILCVSEVTFRRDDNGTHADLILMPPAAFAPEPISLQPLDLSDVSPAS